MPDLAVIVPTRGRPDNIRKVIEAWNFTDAWSVADLVLAVDADDPELEGYYSVRVEHGQFRDGKPASSMIEYPTWRPMVPKLNATALDLAGRYFALGFAGDDHLPRTINWARRYLDVLREMKTGMVYGDDGYQGAKLSTEWAVTSDIVRALGRMVPADVEHMYSDTSLLELTRAAGMARHLPEVRIEHMHPIVKKSAGDEQYARVNSRDQFRRDREAYLAWQRREMPGQLATLRSLSPRTPAPTVRSKAVANRSRRVIRSAPTAKRRARAVQSVPHSSLAPREFRNVRGATPDEIGVALADMAAQVTADHAIVEIGVFQGRTALLMAWGASQGHGAHVWGIDAWELEANTYDAPFKTPESRNQAHYNVKATGYADRVTLIQGFSDKLAPQWDGLPIGLLFVDGDHTYDGARSDILAWAPHLAPGAVIAVDDYGHPDWPGVAEAVDDLVSAGVLEPVQIFHDRLAVTKMATSPDAGKVTAVTGEGVHPSPEPHRADICRECGSGLLPDGEHVRTDLAPCFSGSPDRATLEAEWRRVDPDGVAALEQSAGDYDRRQFVQDGEADGIAAGTSIDNLTIAELKSVARARKITLGARKDKRSAILQALRDGQ